MIPYLKKTLILSAVAIAVTAIPHAYADGLIDSIVQPYKSSSASTAASLLQYARALFWSLAALQFIGGSIKIALQGGEMIEWSAHIVRQIIFVGLYAWFMENSYKFSLDIVDSFRQAGSNAKINPTGVFAAGESIANAISKHSSAFHPFDATLYSIACVVIIVAFAWISALLILALCEMYVLIAAGVILMGFGGSEWTRDFANKNLILAMSVGAKIFIIEIIISIGWSIIRSWSTKEYDSNLAVFEALAGAIIFVLLTYHLPNMASQFISGAATGSTAADGIKAVTQAGAGAALAATGIGAAVGAAASAGAGAGAGASAGAEAALGASGGASGAGAGGGARLGGTPQPPPSTANQAGQALGRIGHALAQGVRDEAWGRLTGTGIKGGTMGGRMAAYIKQNASPPPPPPQEQPENSSRSGSIS
ncbi:P-type conjugative transfer protein TrbL [Asaia spathodeae]|uniref:P-type conjugative transfer protein TrbL n=1 Tax=Asaia spathodeae TaxID=657016 RepID=A0ABX2P8D0_9PROT|nr:P-type conjugative transfer protein TrbL [Asaia spathodeae]